MFAKVECWCSVDRSWSGIGKVVLAEDGNGGVTDSGEVVVK